MNAEDIELDPARYVLVDPEPDERGQVLAMAITESGTHIALSCSTN